MKAPILAAYFSSSWRDVLVGITETTTTYKIKIIIIIILVQKEREKETSKRKKKERKKGRNDQKTYHLRQQFSELEESKANLIEFPSQTWWCGEYERFWVVSEMGVREIFLIWVRETQREFLGVDMGVDKCEK